MNRKNSFILALAIVAFSAASADAAIDGVWKYHPALDLDSRVSTGAITNNVSKIIDTEKYVYFQITGKLHYEDKNRAPGFDERVTFPARLDKTVEGGRVEPLANFFELSGTSVATIEYSRKGGYLVVAYDNRMIDIIFDDGRKVSVADYASFNEPADLKPRTVSFDLTQEHFYLATGCGYVEVNAADGKVTEIANFGTPLNFASRVGDTMVVGSETGVYTYPAGKTPARLADAAHLAPEAGCSQYLLDAEGYLAYPYMIFPTADDEFIYISTRLNTTADNARGLSINAVTLPEEEGGRCRLVNIASDNTSTNMSTQAIYAADIVYDGLASVTKDGFIISTDTYFFHVRPDGQTVDYTAAKPADDYKARVLTTVKKDTAKTTKAGNERYKRHGSYDGETFYIHYPHEGFQRRRFNGTAWETVGTPIETNATSAYEPMYMVAHPEYGLLVRNWSMDGSHDIYQYQTDGLSALDADGNWRQFSMMKLNNANSRIVWSPSGVSVDPANTDYVYGTYRLHGIFRQNLKDPADFKVYTRADKSAANKISIATKQLGSVYDVLCPFTPPVFDDDQTLWTVYGRFPGDECPEPRAEIWYWTKEDRMNTATQEEYDAHPMKKIFIPGIQGPQFGYLALGKTAQNRNTMMCWQRGYGNDAFIFDHNGTPDDTSDDKVAVIDNFIDENGDRFDYIDIAQIIFEDPYDGAFLISTAGGLMCATRSDLFDFDTKRISHVKPEFADGVYPSQAFGDACDVVAIVADGLNRKWVATRHGGLYCLSEDRSQILAYFTMENSPLVSNDITELYYDATTGALNICTGKGLQQFFAEGTPTAGEGMSVKAIPSIVDRDYNGYVRFSGLADGRDYILEDAEGNEAATLRATSGKAEWHPQDAAPGIYRLREFPSVEVILNR